MRTRSYLWEIPLFFLALTALNHAVWPDLPGFIEVSPHPYWIGILLFGFRYGIPAGFTAGVVACINFFIMVWAYGERFLFEDAAFYFQPGLFIVVGIMLGAGVERYRKRIKIQEAAIKLNMEKQEILAGEIKTLKEVSCGLEKRLVSRMATLVTMYEGARRLEATELDDVYDAIADFTVKTLEVEQLALYLARGSRFELARSRGWKSPDEWPTSFKQGEGVGGLSAGKGRVVTVRDFLAGGAFPSIPLKDALAAGPLRDGESGDVIGVLCLQRMPFVAFNSATVNLFSFLTGWYSRAIGRAGVMARLKAEEVLDSATGLYSPRYFHVRSEEEFARSKTYYLPLSVGMVGVDGLKVLGAKQREAVLLSIATVLRERSRPMDIVATLGEGPALFGMLMITASSKQAEEIRSRMLAGIQRLSAPVSVRFGLAHFTPGSESVTELQRMATAEMERAP